MEKPTFALDAELTLRIGDTLLANSKRIELLKQVNLTENLTKSARLAGYSYKGAWDAIEQMTQLTGDSLLERHTGGKGGGKTKLTLRGQQLLKNFLTIQAEHARFIGRLNKLAHGLDSDYTQQTEIAMKTSARNQFAGIIESILQGPVSDEITLRLNGSVRLVASITHESSRDLHLDIGSKVFALIKASSIRLRASSTSEAGTPLNQMIGEVIEIRPGASRSEVRLWIGGDTHLVCTLPNDEADPLVLRPGSKLAATIDPSNIIIGIAA